MEMDKENNNINTKNFMYEIIYSKYNTKEIKIIIKETQSKLIFNLQKAKLQFVTQQIVGVLIILFLN